MDCTEWNRSRKEREYWIDRSGKIHKFKGDLSEEYASFHSEIASKLYPESNRPTDILMQLGWVMVGSVVYHSPIIDKEPSTAQVNKLDKLGLYEHLCIYKSGLYVKYSTWEA